MNKEENKDKESKNLRYCVKIINLLDGTEEIVQNIWTDNPLVVNSNDNVILLDIFRDIKSMYNVPIDFILKKNELIISIKEKVISKGYFYNSTVTVNKELFSLKFIPISSKFNILVEMDSVVTQTQPLEAYEIETQTDVVYKIDKDTDIDRLYIDEYLNNCTKEKCVQTVDKVSNESQTVNLVPINRKIKRFNITDAIDTSSFDDSFRSEFVYELKNKINEKVNMKKKYD